ncbi:MAG: hypothetical protein PHF97_09260 [Bacteroidales bacterium]|nr:hypothetical protein [Bacteroidales bacterium]
MKTNFLNIALPGLLLAYLVMPIMSQAQAVKNTGANHEISLSGYPATDEKEWGQLLWNLKLANQDPADFTNYHSVDEQGVSACRYTVAFSSYFLALEQYHKFPAWREALQPAIDNLINRMLRKEVWGYWSHESQGITKFEPNMDRPYPRNDDPVSLGNIMYSGHLGMMINLYQMLYHDMKWDQPGSIVFKFDDKEQFVYNNRSLQEVMLLQMLHNPVPGIECERNAIFWACNTHPMISWMLYDKMHGTRYFTAAHTVFDPWVEKTFIDPKTKDLASFYLIKQGWAFSGANPKYGNKMDAVMAGMVKKGVDFNSGGNDGWIGTFTHTWNPKLINNLYPYLKKKHCKINANGTATMTKDVVAPDCYYAFFAAMAAEVGDEVARKGLLKTVDSIYSPVWEDGTFHYPFMDNVPTVNLAAADGDKKPAAPPATTVTPASSGDQKNLPACCRSTQIEGHGDACNMKTFPSHSDLADRLIAMARALPSNGLNTMVNKPFDDQYFTEPTITGVDITKVILKRAIYDRNEKALIISTRAKDGAGNTTIKVVSLDPGKSYALKIDKAQPTTIAKQAECLLTLDAGITHDIIVKEK